MITMKKSVLTAFITVVCVTSSVMAADDNAITDGSVTFKSSILNPISDKSLIYRFHEYLNIN